MHHIPTRVRLSLCVYIYVYNGRIRMKGRRGKMECRKHNHRSEQGVCPCCLRDKLSRLPFYVQTRSPSSSSPVSPAPAMSLAAVNIHQRSGSMSFALREALTDFHGSGLKKSRSMAFPARDHTKTMTKKKKSTAAAKKLGFWTKLLPFRGKAAGSDGGLLQTRQRFHY